MTSAPAPAAPIAGNGAAPGGSGYSGSSGSAAIRDERAATVGDPELGPAATLATSPVTVPTGTQAAPAVPIHIAAAATSAPAPAAPSPAAPSPAAPSNFAAQLGRPLFTIATGPSGEHLVTVKVTPENLGPVTVRAHIGVDGIRMELFAPTDAGREALRSILTDLRRDLAGQGVNAGLDLSGQNRPTEGQQANGQQFGGSGGGDAGDATSDRPDRSVRVAEPESATRGRDTAALSTLDVLA